MTAGSDTTYALAQDQDTQETQQLSDGATLLTRPGVSNLNYLKGQTVAGMSLSATNGPIQQLEIYNHSPGTGDVVLDVVGYFSS